MPITIQMPKLSDTMTEGTLVKWRKEVGDTVEMGDIIAEVETDKATMEMEAFEDGVVHELMVEEGGKVAVGEAVMILLAEGEDASSVSEEKSAEPKIGTEKEVASGKAKPAKTSEPAAEENSSEKKAAPAESSGERRKSSPLARKIAGSKGVDLANVEGTGPGGRIVAADVEKAQSAPPKKAAPAKSGGAPAAPKAGEERKLPLSGMRKVIAQRLVESKTTIPHFYLNIDVDAGPLLALRAQLKAAGELVGVDKLTINDFVLRAAALAATLVPRINSTFTETAIIEYGSVHLSVAVSLEDGLITPVIRDAQTKSISELSSEMKDLATRARNKKLKPEEYQGGTLSLSNLGAYGIDSFYAILNPPQAAILAIGAIVKKPVVNAEGAIVAGNVMNIGLSGDHRVADGAVAAQYLNELRKLIENPSVLLA